MPKKKYYLQFFTNCKKWQDVDSGTQEEMFKELDKRAKLFNDADRYRVTLK